MMRSRRSSYVTLFERRILPASASAMRFLRNSAASDRLVKSVASRIVRLPATNSMYQLLVYCGAGGGSRTHTPLAGPRILSPVRLPVPPPRHLIQWVELKDSTPASFSVVHAFSAWLSPAASGGLSAALQFDGASRQRIIPGHAT